MNKKSLKKLLKSYTRRISGTGYQNEYDAILSKDFDNLISDVLEIVSKETKSLKLEKLLDKYYEVVHWEPDYETYGLQVGPSTKGIDKLIEKIWKLDPEWVPYMTSRVEDEFRYSKNIKLNRIWKKKHFSNVVWNDKFITQMDDNHLKNTLNYLKRLESYHHIQEAISFEIEMREIGLHKQKPVTHIFSSFDYEDDYSDADFWE